MSPDRVAAVRQLDELLAERERQLAHVRARLESGIAQMLDNPALDLDRDKIERKVAEVEQIRRRRDQLIAMED